MYTLVKNIIKHSERFLDINSIGSTIPNYKPNYDFSGEYIDLEHQRIGNLKLNDRLIEQPRANGGIVEGWLRREDALKLYELAYFADGDILELGCFRGLSTSILARAIANSEITQRKEFTIDIDPINTEATKLILKEFDLNNYAEVETGNANEYIEILIKRKKSFNLVFVDHSHAFEEVFLVCKKMPQLLKPECFCLFHDYNDIRNCNPEDKEHKVYQAVTEGLADGQFEFVGIYGCTGVYIKRP